MKSRPCIFLDRDGVINVDFVDYVYTIEKFTLISGVAEAISNLKSNDYLMVIITNQSGIAKGLYTREQMNACHQHLQQMINHQIDDIYYAPFHESNSASLSRKPGALMFERAIAKYNIDIEHSWMVGDKKRDIEPAKRLGLKTIQVGKVNDGLADYLAKDLLAASAIILGE